jgi:hypothetical protein
MNSPLEGFVEPLSLLTAELTRISADIQALQEAHYTQIEAAAIELKNNLREQITIDLQQKLDYDFREATRIMRAEFDERLRSATADWAVERESLLSEMTNLRSRADRRELSAEIAKTDTALAEVRQKIDSMVDDPTVAVAKLTRASARETELKAYLKGLKFKAIVLNAGAPADTSEQPAKATASAGV